jgi:hypothetical protein
VRDAAKIKGVSETSLTIAEALETWLLSLPKKQFDSVMEQLETAGNEGGDGLTDEEWVQEGDREREIDKLLNRSPVVDEDVSFGEY